MSTDAIATVVFLILMGVVIVAPFAWFGITAIIDFFSSAKENSKLVSLLQKENAGLQEEIEKLRTSKQTLNNSIKDLSERISELREEIDERSNRLAKSAIDQAEWKYNAIITARDKEISQLKKDKTATARTVKKELEYLELSLNLAKAELSQIKSTLCNNLTAFPHMAGVVADYETYGLEFIAQKLDWGTSQKRLKKVKAIREIRKDAREMIARHKEAEYQLAYLLQLFPVLQEVIEVEFSELPPITSLNIEEDVRDRTKDFLSEEEYKNLSTTEKNQLALDRYCSSHNKTKWQIGRDYELYVGYKYTLDGYDVDYFGSYMGLEDLGRDLIAKKNDTVLIVQCKYWSSVKQIHEKHVAQLYGTMVSYCIENNLKKSQVKGMIISNISLSEEAKKMANFLKIGYTENFPVGQYPRIKCNIGTDEYGTPIKIYHLPFDQQYDSTKIDKPGEFFAMTVKEAEDAGFRRAHKWFSSP